MPDCNYKEKMFYFNIFKRMLPALLKVFRVRLSIVFFWVPSLESLNFQELHAPLALFTGTKSTLGQWERLSPIVCYPRYQSLHYFVSEI